MTDRDLKGRFQKIAKPDEEAEDFLQRPPSTKLILIILAILIFLLWFPHDKGRRMMCTYLCRPDDFAPDSGNRPSPPFNHSPENPEKLTTDEEVKTTRRPEK
jgi:hypothetical protein